MEKKGYRLKIQDARSKTDERGRRAEKRGISNIEQGMPNKKVRSFNRFRTGSFDRFRTSFFAHDPP